MVSATLAMRLNAFRIPTWLCGGVLFFATSNTTFAQGVKYTNTGFIAAPDTAQPNDGFGDAISIVGDFIAISSRADDTTVDDGGAVYVYDMQGNFRTILESPQPETGTGNAGGTGSFGEYIAAVGDDRIVVAARHESEKAGRAYLFDLDGNEVATFESPTPTPGEEFGGRSVLSNGDAVFVAAWTPPVAFQFFTIFGSGKAYLFDTDGELRTTFLSPNSDPAIDTCLGRSAAFVGDDKILIGDYCADLRQEEGVLGDVGAAYLYDLGGNLLQTFNNPEPGPGDLFGSSVAYAGGRVLIGSVLDTNPEAPECATLGCGAAYIFELDGSLVARLDDPEPFEVSFEGDSNWFGWNAGSVGDELFIVGSSHHSSEGMMHEGKVFLYDLDGNLVETLSSPEPGPQQFFGSSFAHVGNELLIGEAYYGGGFDGDGVGRVWRFTREEDQGLPGDINDNGVVDVADLDLLCTAVSQGQTTSDLNGDGATDSADVQLFLELSGGFAGDTDLNGAVEFADFLALAGNFGQAGTWSQGDFDCDGAVAFADFLNLSQNFGKVAAAAVPEPTGATMLLWTTLGTLYCFRSRRENR